MEPEKYTLRAISDNDLYRLAEFISDKHYATKNIEDTESEFCIKVEQNSSDKSIVICNASNNNLDVLRVFDDGRALVYNHGRAKQFLQKHFSDGDNLLLDICKAKMENYQKYGIQGLSLNISQKKISTNKIGQFGDLGDLWGKSSSYMMQDYDSGQPSVNPYNQKIDQGMQTSVIIGMVYDEDGDENVTREKSGVNKINPIKTDAAASYCRIF